MYPIGQYQAGNLATQGGSAAPPPQPPFDNIALCVALDNFNNDGYAGPGVNISGSDISTITFTADPPYPLQWANVTDAGDPPYSLITWYDQNGNANDLAGPFGARPILDATNKLISFDGATQGLRGSANLYDGSNTGGTLYFDFAPQSLIETGVIFETGPNATADRAGAISIRIVAGVLTVSIFDNTPVVSLPNTKIKTLTNTDRIWVCVTFDTTASAANQVQLYVNNSQTGVTSTATANLSGIQIGKEQPNLGARNNAASSFLTADFWEGRAQTNIDDSATMLEAYNYWIYLQTQ